MSWQGEINGDQYRGVGRDDSYNGLAWSIESSGWPLANEWSSISSGDEADPPECAAVAAHLAQRIAELETRLACGDTERIVAQEECETLRARLARLRLIARAAVLARRTELAVQAFGDPKVSDPTIDAWRDTVEKFNTIKAALSEEERAEMLEETK